MNIKQRLKEIALDLETIANDHPSTWPPLVLEIETGNNGSVICRDPSSLADAYIAPGDSATFGSSPGRIVIRNRSELTPVNNPAAPMKCKRCGVLLHEHGGHPFEFDRPTATPLKVQDGVFYVQDPGPGSRQCDNCKRHFIGAAKIDAKLTFCGSECQFAAAAKEADPLTEKGLKEMGRDRFAAAAIMRNGTPKIEVQTIPATVCDQCGKPFDIESGYRWTMPGGSQKLICSSPCMKLQTGYDL